VYGQALYLLASSSTSGGACSCLNPYKRPYHSIAKTTQGIPKGEHIFQPSVGTSRSSTSTVSPNQDSTDDYPEIGGSICWNLADEGRLIIMVAPTRTPSQNNSSKYPTIGRSEASDARSPNDGMIRYLNPYLNTARLRTIMESIQRMTPEGSSLVALAQHGAEAANYIIVERSAGNPRGEPSIRNRSYDQAKRARSEAASSVSANHRLANNDACR
jgi:hypothetical protein